MHPALQKIITRSGVPQLVDVLSQGLSVGQLTTLLLEVYRQKTAAQRPHELLAGLSQNRFVQPSPLDPLVLREGELVALKAAQAAGFEAIELSPVAPLGVSSVYGRVNQNNVLTALRQCEVVADPSNQLCLLMADKIAREEGAALDWVCSHRALRTAYSGDPSRYAHFQLLAACSVHYAQQVSSLLPTILLHLQLHQQILSQFGFTQLRLKVWLKNQQAEIGQQLWSALQEQPDLECVLAESAGTDYYQGFQVKLYAKTEREWLEMADMGLVNWAAELRGDKHLHCLISGLGLERLLLDT